jgi:hypothetical protein
MFGVLSEDVIQFHLFDFLDEETYCLVRLVCKQWTQRIDEGEEQIWKEKCFSLYPTNHTLIEELNEPFDRPWRWLYHALTVCDWNHTLVVLIMLFTTDPSTI